MCENSHGAGVGIAVNGLGPLAPFQRCIWAHFWRSTEVAKLVKEVAWEAGRSARAATGAEWLQG